MTRPHQARLVDGALAGLIGGAVVALWFLVLDAAAGRPFHTPLLLARLMLGEETGAGAAQLVVGYTVLHFGTFAVIGMLTAGVLSRVPLRPGLLAGAVLGIGVLQAVHYVGLLLTGAEVVAVLPPGHVLAASALSGIAIVRYLHYAMHVEGVFGLAALRSELVTRGLVTGVIGAAAVALWFLMVDAWQGRPFFTPAALGSAVFLGATGPGSVQVSIGIVAAYTVVHLAAFGAVGIALVWVAERIRRAPEWWLLALLAFIILEGAFVGAATSLAGAVLGALGWWAVAAANLIAIAAMFGWIWRTHPELRRSLRETEVQTRV